MLRVSMAFASTFMPAPGCQRFTTSRPIIRASVVIASKYTSAFSPTRPTFFMSCMPAMPCTTVQKMIGPITILMAAMNMSPSGFRLAPVSGKKYPIRIPRAIAQSTCTYR